MRTITISNLKGGVGKTTSAVNLAFSLSLMGKRVLVVDADPQTNLTPFFTNANPNGHTLRDVLNRPDQVKCCVYRSRYAKVDIIKGDTGIQEEEVCTVWVIDRALHIVGERYDYCVIDTRPAFERLTEAAFHASDMILTPACLDKFCRDNLALVEDYISDNFGGDPDELQPIWRIFATKVDEGRRAQRKIFADLMEKHEYSFLHTCISRSAVVDNALEYYKPVQKHRSGSPVTADYMELAREVMELFQGREAQ